MLEIKLLPGSEIEIIGEIASDVFMSFRQRVVSEIVDSARVDGFRQGKAPESVVLKTISEETILGEMANLSLNEFYPKIVTEHKIKTVGPPKVLITKLALNNPLGFKITTSVWPEINIVNYKNIAKNVFGEKKDLFVSEDEVESVVESLRKSKAVKNEKGEDVSPSLSDDFAKSVGAFENMDALKNTIKANLAAEKETREKEIKRTEFLDKMAEDNKQDSPKFLLEIEKNNILEEIKKKTNQTGMNWGDYLKHIKKTEEELKKEIEKEAEKRVKYGLILDSIIESEKIEISNEDLEKETSMVMSLYKKHGQEADENQVKKSLVGMMRNEKLFQMMEKEAETKKYPPPNLTQVRI